MCEARSLAALEIGGLRIDPPLLLAPMAGYTDRAMRSVCALEGAALAYTEVVQSVAIARRIPVAMHMISQHPDEAPLVGHIYGSDPESMAAAARVMEELGGFVAIDINCGCPVRKIVAKGAGAALLRDPRLIAEIVRAVRAAVSLPVMVKTRLGFSPEEHNIEEIAQRAQEAGADAIAVHARYATARHSGPADYAALARLKPLLSIPLIGNGGVVDAGSAAAMLDESGVDAVMVGRGAVGNPWIFEQIRADWSGRDWSPPTSVERVAMIRTHLERLYEYIAEQRRYRRAGRHSAERSACLKFRGHLHRYMRGAQGIKELMRRIDGIYTIDGLVDAAADCLGD
jgi:tRNA-dihydrouridine synthase B